MEVNDFQEVRTVNKALESLGYYLGNRMYVEQFIHENVIKEFNESLKKNVYYLNGKYFLVI